MTSRARVAWSLFGLTVVLAGVHTWLFLGWSEVREHPTGWPVLTFGLPVWAALGAVIITRRPGHRVAWLFIVGAVCAELGNCLFGYDAVATSGASPDPGPVWPWALWLAQFLDAPEPLLFLILLFLLFPTGHLPSRRWRPLLWASLLSFGTFVLILAIAVPPWQIDLANRDDLYPSAVKPFGIAVLVTLLLELLAAAASVVVRLRQARGVERQQLRWLAVSASMVAVTFVLAAFLPWQTGLGGWLRVLPLHLSVIAVVAGCGLAILRYRLYDLDLVVSRAILLTLSTGAVAAGYALLVVLVGDLLPRVSDAFWPSLLATAAVALAFQPLRRHIVRLADRLAFGRRAAPYEALAEFGRHLQQAPDADGLLRNVAQAVAEATGARRTTAVLELPDGAEVVQAWPPGDGAGRLGELTDFAVTDRGERLGRVGVEMPPGRPLRPAEAALAVELLAQSAVAVRNLRLETELAAEVAELDRRTTQLTESRRQLVLARDEEKSRFAAALRQTVLPHLAPLPDRLAAAADRTAHGDVQPLDLEPERVAAGAALEELRRLVRGAGPAARQGAAADQAASSRSGPNADLVT